MRGPHGESELRKCLGESLLLKSNFLLDYFDKDWPDLL